MSITKITLFSSFVVGVTILVVLFASYALDIKVIVLECSTEFWENNLELWKVVGLDYNSDFDETFGQDYFEPDITLEQAIKKQGVGMNHLARSGTTAYLNALADPKINEESIRSAVNFGYVHQIDNYLENCNEVELEIPNLLF